MTSTTWAVLLAATVIDALVLLGILFGGSGRPLDLARLGAALVATAFVFAVKTAALAVWAGTAFFAIHLAYVDTMVLLPVAGAVVLLAARRRAVTRGVRVLAILALAFAPVGAHATFVAPYELVAERATIPVSTQRAGSASLRVAVLSDLQSEVVDSHLERAVDIALAFEPHLILLPGDLIHAGPHRYQAAVPGFRALLARLSAPLGVYFVLGNTDRRERIEPLLQGTQVRLLENEVVELRWEDRTILLGGCGFWWRDRSVARCVDELERRAGKDDIRLLVSHYPDVVHHLAQPSRIDLLVAGHTHGGQVQLPFLGPITGLSTVPRSVAAGGFHVLDGRPLYVSRGVGVERGLAPPVRFLCPPEVSLLTLETAAAAP